MKKIVKLQSKRKLEILLLLKISLWVSKCKVEMVLNRSHFV